MYSNIPNKPLSHTHPMAFLMPSNKDIQKCVYYCIDKLFINSNIIDG